MAKIHTVLNDKNNESSIINIENTDIQNEIKNDITIEDMKLIKNPDGIHDIEKGIVNNVNESL